ncbi:MAG: tetratricopeptide repeat protein [Myxococcales bacterium]|nr:tetratricopeptide repeat protein [Myxococcales bacterium]
MSDDVLALADAASARLRAAARPAPGPRLASARLDAPPPQRPGAAARPPRSAQRPERSSGAVVTPADLFGVSRRDADALAALAAEERLAGRLDDAAETLEVLTSLDPWNGAAWLDLARVYRERGERSRAEVVTLVATEMQR